MVETGVRVHDTSVETQKVCCTIPMEDFSMASQESLRLIEVQKYLVRFVQSNP